VIAQNPVLESAGRGVRGNVRHDSSRAGYVRSVKLGPPRVRLAWSWNLLDPTDEAARAGAYADSDEGAKAVFVQDEDGNLRWMKITDEDSVPTPVIPGDLPADRAYSARLTLEEALL
jgi:hypothetical protein